MSVDNLAALGRHERDTAFREAKRLAEVDGDIEAKLAEAYAIGWLDHRDQCKPDPICDWSLEFRLPGWTAGIRISNLPKDQAVTIGESLRIQFREVFVGEGIGGSGSVYVAGPQLLHRKREGQYMPFRLEEITR